MPPRHPSSLDSIPWAPGKTKRDGDRKELEGSPLLIISPAPQNAASCVAPWTALTLLLFKVHTMWIPAWPGPNRLPTEWKTLQHQLHQCGSTLWLAWALCTFAFVNALLRQKVLKIIFCNCAAVETNGIQTGFTMIHSFIFSSIVFFPFDFF